MESAPRDFVEDYRHSHRKAFIRTLKHVQEAYEAEYRERVRHQKAYNALASKSVWRDDDWNALEELRSAIANLPGGSGSGGPAYLMSLAAKLVAIRKRLCKWEKQGTSVDDHAHHYKTQCGHYEWSDKPDYCPHCGGRVINAATPEAPNAQDQGAEGVR
jgi:hypothetical protein